MTKIGSLVRKDLSQIVHNRSLILTILSTLIFALILPQILTFQVRNVSIAVINYDHSELADHILRDITNTTDFTIAGQCTTYEEALSLVKHGNADCIIEIPHYFERNFLHQAMGRSDALPQIQISVNAINTTKVVAATQSIAGSIAKVLSDYAGNKGVMVSKSDSVITTLNLYNPSSDYKLLMIPVLTLAIILVFGVATRLYTNELQYGTLDQIIVSPMGRFEFMAAKTITGYIVSITTIMTTTVIMWWMYDFVSRGSLLLVFLALSLYVLSCTSIALTICTRFQDVSQIVLVTSVVSLIAMMVSGQITPIECMAEWVQPLSYLFPTRYVVMILRNVSLKDSGITDLATEFVCMAGLSTGFFILSVLSCKTSRD